MVTISDARVGIVLGGLLLIGIGLATDQAQEPTEEEAAAGFVSLFNGQDFTGWRFGDESPPKEVPANWKVQEGCLTVDGQQVAAGARSALAKRGGPAADGRHWQVPDPSQRAEGTRDDGP